MVSTTAATWLIARAVRSPAHLESSLVTGLLVAFLLFPTAEPRALLVVALATVVLVVAGWRLGWRPLHDGAVVLRGASVMAVVAFLTNDSGLVIPAFVVVVLAPLLVAAGSEGELPRHHGDVREVGS